MGLLSMRRLTAGDETQLIQAQRFPHLKSGTQMPEVDGIEGAAEDTEHGMRQSEAPWGKGRGGGNCPHLHCTPIALFSLAVALLTYLPVTEDDVLL